MTENELAKKNAQFAKGVMELAFRMGYVTRDDELVRCKDCKHRPSYDNRKRITPPRLEVEYDDDGEPWIWDDDMTCPYLCGDSYYNQMPDDEQFCDRGERKEE